MTIPTVGYKVEGIAEIISDGKSGYIVKQGDFATLAKKIAELLDDSEKRKAFGMSARNIALSKWSHEAMNVKLRALYWKLLKGSKNEL